VTDTTALLLVLLGVGYAVWHWRNRYTPPIAPGGVPDTAELREFEVALVHCQHPDHHPQMVPFAPIRHRHADEDVRQISLNGWGATERMNACRVHNTDGWRGGLHVQCSLPGCQTPAVIPVDDPEMGIRSLRAGGWRNLGDQAVCPYCAGTRSRVWR